jgi:hypothetical protein
MSQYKDDMKKIEEALCKASLDISTAAAVNPCVIRLNKLASIADNIAKQWETTGKDYEKKLSLLPPDGSIDFDEIFKRFEPLAKCDQEAMVFDMLKSISELQDKYNQTMRRMPTDFANLDAHSIFDDTNILSALNAKLETYNMLVALFLESSDFEKSIGVSNREFLIRAMHNELDKDKKEKGNKA